VLDHVTTRPRDNKTTRPESCGQLSGGPATAVGRE